MKKYYLYGAGSNCYGAINFIGEERIISIVDGNPTKQGCEYLGISIISPKDFLKRYNGETVIISAFLLRKEIIKNLENIGVKDIEVFPLIQTGLYSSKVIINRWRLDRFSNPIFWGDRCLSRVIAEALNLGCSKNIFENKNDFVEEALRDADALIRITNNDYSANDIKGIETIDIYKEMLEDFDFRYKNNKSLKDKHLGKRCFLIGNGPSLHTNDLDMLHDNGEICFATNRIHLIYPETAWRPDYYFLVDAKEFDHNKSELNRKNMTFIIKDFIGNDIEATNNCYVFRNYDSEFGEDGPLFSYDMEIGLYAGRTTMYQMLQVAVYMGFSEIYLLGVDMSWGKDGQDSHFIKDYGLNSNGTVEDYSYAEKYESDVLLAYNSARIHAEQKRIKIYNATRGGYLDVFDRVNFDNLW